MAVTLATDLQESSSAYKNISHEDFLDLLDTIEPAQCPMMALTENIVELGSTESAWNVDTYDAPGGALGVADGAGVTTADVTDHTGNIRKIGNIAQGHRQVHGVGWIAQHVPRVAGVSNLMSRAKLKAAVQLKRQQEVAFCSLDQTALADAGGNLGAIGAGYLKLTASANKYTSASAFVFGKPSDIHFAPSGAAITGTLTAVHSRTMWKNISFALRVVAQQDSDYTLLAGLKLRQAITDLTDPVFTAQSAVGASAVGGATQVKVILRGEEDTTLGATIDVIQTDFGRILVKSTDYVGYTTVDSTGGALASWATNSAHRILATFSSNQSGGLVIKRGNVFKRFGVPTFSQEIAYSGGSNSFDTKCLVMFGVRHPSLAGHINFTG